MGFGEWSGDETGDRRQRQPFAGRLRFTGTLSGGGGNAAVSIRQPMQQFSAQALPLSCPPAGAVWPVSSVWQMTPRVLLASAAARAAVKLASRLASAIA